MQLQLKLESPIYCLFWAGCGIEESSACGRSVCGERLRDQLHPSELSEAHRGPHSTAFAATRALEPTFGQPWPLCRLEFGMWPLKHRKARVIARYLQRQVCTQQQGSTTKRAGRAQGTLNVVCTLTGAVCWAAHTQINLQAATACAQVQRNGAVSIHPSVRPRHAFFGGVVLPHDEAVDDQGQIARV